MATINLCEILKGHEGETFYSPICGDMVLLSIDDGMIFKSNFISPVPYAFHKDGTYVIGGECLVFPSKTQRNWNTWLEEQKPKVPKTWSEFLLINKDYERYKLVRSIYLKISESSLIEKSVLASLKIHQLIDVGYGGNITDEEWKNDDIKKYIIHPYFDKETSIISFDINKLTGFCFMSLLSFHTEEQAEEFLKYPENIQLLKDYLMI